MERQAAQHSMEAFRRRMLIAGAAGYTGDAYDDEHEEGGASASTDRSDKTRSDDAGGSERAGA